MFLDDTACNLASLNLLTFRDDTTKQFDVESYEHAVRLWTIVLEISVMMASFPSKNIAELSYRYRTLGLGYANLGGLLMSSGIPYDSDEARAICAALSAIMTGVSYATSAEMARELGAFPGYEPNREHMLRVMRNHARAAYGEKDGYEQVAIAPVPIDTQCLPGQAPGRAREARLEQGAQSRPAVRLPQRAVERDRADRHDRPRDGLRHHRHRARLRACEVQEARRRRLLQDHQPRGAGSLAHARLSAKARSPRSRPMRSVTARSRTRPASTIRRSKTRGFDDATIATIEKKLPAAFDIKFVFNRWTLGDDTLKKIGIPDEQLAEPRSSICSRISASASARWSRRTCMYAGR